MGWWGWRRVTADGRRLVVRETPGAEAPPLFSGDTIRILTWNIAHGRGDRPQGPFENWKGGTAKERLDRLDSIAEVLRRVDADVVVLNEVDFDAQWSGGVDQAAFLATAADYPTRVEQRNFDFGVPFEAWAFGNALLSRLPVASARWVELPAHSGLEEAVIGSKEASVVELETTRGRFAVVPVHLEFRDEATRLRAVPALQAVRSDEAAPLVLAGDFNTAPPGWPHVDVARTALSDLLGDGMVSARAAEGPALQQLTFPTFDLQESRDWVLVESPLRVVRSDVVRGTESLSDHAPVLAVVELTASNGD